MQLPDAKTYLVNLLRRPDRLDNFRKLQNAHGWKLPEPVIYPAIEGDKVGVPTYFSQGGGAFGCCRSHVNILERAIMEDVDTVVMLEDDVTFDHSAWDQLETFLSNVPTNWDQLMLGGQHLRAAEPTKIPGVVKCVNTQRTHAYVIRGKAMKSLLNLWYNCDVHIDWKMGDWQHEKNVYAPEPFIFSQAGGKSDISGRTNPAYTWSQNKGTQSRTHILVLRSPRSVVDNLTGFHRGYFLHSSGIDNGLLEVMTSSNRVDELTKWLNIITQESARGGTVPCVWCDGISLAEVQAAAPGRHVVEITSTSIDEVTETWRSK